MTPTRADRTKKPYSVCIYRVRHPFACADGVWRNSGLRLDREAMMVNGCTTEHQ